ncbi:magnesium transporter [uncultured Boseongicola sp.]|jgi:magnesium transporter|uniref:magnesium transporter n=1 Tax=uncultured Boseongicola sp. TaxID=1648499 RepID=UPI002638C294|nr:magnesium transporter [uncultured Boseongicola sp.]
MANTRPNPEAIRDTAAEHMLTGIPRAHIDTPVEQVIDALRGSVFECADTVFVTDTSGHLQGIVRINDLFADGQVRIGDIMEPEHEAVRLDADQEQIAALAMRLNMIAVPVVDGNERLIGVVPPEALFRILREEHMEDLQLIAGITPHDDGPSAALDASIVNRISRRLPWLVFGLVASSLITVVMVRFEHALAANVAVAFFVPALVYIAGAIGTQAVSVSVRSLARDDVQILPLLRDELVIGIGIGAALGVLAAGAVLGVFGDQLLATAVGLSVLAGGAMSAVVGFGLPWVFQKLGSDPAMGSGPICTIIQDVTSLFIYFGLVSLLVL